MVSRESGVCKTETTKMFMRYLTYLGWRSVVEERIVEQRIFISSHSYKFYPFNYLLFFLQNCYLNQQNHLFVRSSKSRSFAKCYCLLPFGLVNIFLLKCILVVHLLLIAFSI